MFISETTIFNATVSGVSVATIGTILNVEPFFILVGVSIVGSLASVGLRWMKGHLKDWPERCMAFVCGVILAVASIPYLEKKGLMDLEPAIFVLAISLIGARAIKYISTDFDVGSFVDAIIKRIRGGQ